MSVKISLEMPAPLSTSSCHVIDPDDSRMTVCGATLQTHERDAKECTACYSKLTEVAESFNVLMMEELASKIMYEKAQTSYQAHSNRRIRAQRLTELAIKYGVLG